MEKKHEKHWKSHTNGKPSTSVHFSPSCKSSSEKGLRTRFAIALRMQGWSHWPLTCTKLWSARSSLRNRKIGEVCRDGIRVVRLRGSSIDQSVVECQTSDVCTFLSTPGGTGGTNGGGTHLPIPGGTRGTIGADTGLPAPGFFLGRSCTCRARIELQSGELWAAGGLANACLHRKVFQERQSFDQLELQQLFLDLYRPYSLSAHSLDTGTLVPWKCKNASGTYSVIGNLWASGWPSWLKAAFQQETATGKNPTGFYADTCFC